jgi:hypothetical protein
MSDPTIDEMLEWLNTAEWSWSNDHSRECMKAIRAILEHQRLVESPVERVQLAAIRAFVARVEKRGCWNGECVMREELAAMEAEVKE